MQRLVDPSRFHCTGAITYELVEQLMEMPRLKVFQYYGVEPDEDSLNILNEVLFRRRKDITFRFMGFPDTSSDISLLNKLPELERFDWDTNAFGSIEPLYSLKRITHLGLGFSQPKSKISVKFISDFRDSLESVKFDGDYKDLITTVPHLFRLKSIWLISTKLHDFQLLEGLPIETIGNYGSRVNSFELLVKNQALKKIWIKTNTKIRNIDFVEQLPNLEDIELQYVTHITRFPKCDHLQKLKRIFAFQCNNLQDIEEVKKLKNCKVFLSGAKLENHFYKVE